MLAPIVGEPQRRTQLLGTVRHARRGPVIPPPAGSIRQEWPWARGRLGSQSEVPIPPCRVSGPAGMQESGYPACRIEQLAVAFKAEAKLSPCPPMFSW